jgi:peptide/nickel transport system permease protein
MLRFLGFRLLRAVATIALVVTFAFVVLRLSGDPAQIIMGADAPPEAVDAFRVAWGLDRPIWEQYFRYFLAILEGDLGRSMRDGRDAIVLVTERIPATLSLTLPALLIKICLGIPAGIYAALHRNSLADRLVMVVAVAGFTVPSFVLGLLLVLVFAVQLGWLPSGGQESWRHAILPVVTLGLGGAAVLARFTRSAMLEVLGQPFIRTASAKGVPWRRVVYGPCAAQCGDPDGDHHRLHGRQPDRRRGGGGERLLLARRRPAAGGGGRQSRPRRRAVHPAAGGGDDDLREPGRGPALRPARSAAAQPAPARRWRVMDRPLHAGAT